MSKNGWIGVDLDGTLAQYDRWRGEMHIGAPVALMVERVKKWLAEGKEVRIFTARVCDDKSTDDQPSLLRSVIQDWCRQHLGVALRVTHEKDYGMYQLWDDRAIGVVPNTGERADGQI